LFFFLGRDSLVRDLGITEVDQKRHAGNQSETGILATYTTGDNTIERCFTSGSTTGSALVQSLNANHIRRHSIVRNCYSTAKALGFIETCTGGTISNSYYFGDNYSSSAFTNVLDNGAAALAGVYSSITNSFLIGRLPSLRAGTVSYANSVFALTDKPFGFFKDVETYLAPGNWSSVSPWNFNDVWAINEEFNDGLPYMKIFERYFEGPPSYRLGKIIGDGAIDLLDAINIQSIWLDRLVNVPGGNRRPPTPTELLAADINRDGRVDANDLLLILRYLAGDPSIGL